MRYLKLALLILLPALGLAACYQLYASYPQQPLTKAEATAAAADLIKQMETRGAGGRHVPQAFGLGEQLTRLDPAVAASAYEHFAVHFEKTGDRRLGQVAAAMQGNARRLRLPGTQLAELNAKQLDGRPFDLAALHGKVVLIDFWATWCGDCLKEMPRLEALHAKYRERGLEIVAVSVDDDPRDVAAFAAARPKPWITLHDAGGKGPALKYGVNEIPTAFLLDRDGTVLSIDAHGPQLEQQLARRLK